MEQSIDLHNRNDDERNADEDDEDEDDDYDEFDPDILHFSEVSSDDDVHDWSNLRSDIISNEIYNDDDYNDDVGDKSMSSTTSQSNDDDDDDDDDGNLRRIDENWIEIEKQKKLFESLKQITHFSEAECLCCYTFSILYHFICGHSFCFHCIESYIRVGCVETTKVINIKCMEKNCNDFIFSKSTIRAFLNEKIYARYLRLLFIASLEDQSLVRYCVSTNCNGVMVGDPKSPSFPDIQCHECKMLFCFNCMKPSHDPKLCKMNNVFFDESYYNVNIHPCPSCRAAIEKLNGCNLIKCIQCGVNFCWLCNQKISGYEHYGGDIYCKRRLFYIPSNREKIALWEQSYNRKFILTSPSLHPTITQPPSSLKSKPSLEVNLIRLYSFVVICICVVVILGITLLNSLFI